jgi:serine/threonine protein kinase
MTAFRTNSGTQGFMAPEIYAQEGLLDLGNIGELREYTVAVDLWSLGEIIFRAFTKEPPFARSLAAYVTGRVQFPSTQLRKRGVSDDGCKFVASLMKPDPKDRLTASEGLAHCWMATQKPESPRSSGELQR